MEHAAWHQGSVQPAQPGARAVRSHCSFTVKEQSQVCLQEPLDGSSSQPPASKHDRWRGGERV